ncbi:lytic transglycosylase domain-containing protein [Aureimonas mangrovi]|uniref:lytic transglycosylase domain-containing protein n=1 Tax=Aureimonas mangrovi TaxID=2758041 RepID=UPI00163D8C2C|nr:lytic transglycosylase domain-containing protein [Aureimonas mangrovi]
MTRLPAVALAATISLALIPAASAETASSTSTAPVGAPSAKVAGPFDDTPYADLIEAAATAEGVPVELAHAVVFIESTYRADVTGGAGEIGLMQIKLGTARDMGFRGTRKELYDPATNLRYGMKYLAGAKARGGGSVCGTILKYNAGHYAKRSNPVSRRYCERVKVQLAKY